MEDLVKFNLKNVPNWKLFVPSISEFSILRKILVYSCLVWIAGISMSRIDSKTCPKCGFGDIILKDNRFYCNLCGLSFCIFEVKK